MISDSFTTRKIDSFIDIETGNLYNDFLDISKLLNNSDKVCLYHELYVKAFIIENRQLFNDYMKFLESKVYYDFINMMSFYDALVNLSLIHISFSINKWSLSTMLSGLSDLLLIFNSFLLLNLLPPISNLNLD